VRCELLPECGTADRAETAHEVQQRIKTMVGVSCRVEVLDPNGIERSMGKARRVIDQRPR
jgi:phenylacetate-CoA ligase